MLEDVSIAHYHDYYYYYYYQIAGPAPRTATLVRREAIVSSNTRG